jgi:hypothetical protein
MVIVSNIVIAILHDTGKNEHTRVKSMSFIDYNDQSNNPERTVYLYDSFLHMSRDFLSIIDVIVFFSHKTLIRCHFNFSIVEFSCDGKVTVHFCAYWRRIIRETKLSRHKQNMYIIIIKKTN